MKYDVNSHVAAKTIIVLSKAVASGEIAVSLTGANKGGGVEGRTVGEREKEE